MSKSNARLHVVREGWEEEEKRALTYDQLIDEFIARLDRLDIAHKAIEAQSAQNQEARLNLRKEMLERLAQLQEDDGIIRLFLPDTADPIHKLIDSAIDFLVQLRAVAEERPAYRSELSELATLLAIHPALIKSALIGITFPLQDKINQLATLSTERDQSTKHHNSVEDDSEDDDKNPNNPA